MIDFDVCVLVIPTILLGTVLGVMLNSVAPDWLVLAVIALVLAYVAYETIKKAFEIRRKELGLPPKPEKKSKVY